MADVNNKKYPDTQVTPEYPFAKATVNPDGSGYYEDHTPGYEAFRKFFSDGSHTEVSNSPDGGLGREVKAALGKVFHNLADGHSHVVGGHSDVNVAGNHRHNVGGDHHEEHAGNKYSATSGHKIESSGGSSIQHTSDGDKHHITSGNVITDHSGSIHTNIKGDIIEHVGGHGGLIVSGGDYGVNIQAGNIDISSDIGKIHLWSLDELKLESLSTITLKVGTNTIVINQSGITITAAAVSFVKA
jgi:hypothetical protein